MSTMTQTQADRIHNITETVVARMRADADAAEAQGNTEGARAMRAIADSRERAGMRAHAGAKMGRIR